jgi:peptide/nickel transport system permease protein
MKTFVHTLTVIYRVPRLIVARLAVSRKASVGAAVLFALVMMGVLAPVFAPGNPEAVVAGQNLAPSWQHLFGTSGQGNDIFSQVVWGTRNSIGVGVVTGVLIAVVGVAVGLCAAFFGGVVDNILTLVANIFLVIPGIPLLIVMAAFLPRNNLSIVLVLAIAGWATTARIIRSQALSIVRRDYVAAAIVIGERRGRVITTEVLPNLSSLIASVFFGAIGYGIGAQAALQFLGLGSITTDSWGSILFWAQNNQALFQGCWWQFVPPGICLALTCAAISMLNFAIDEITNPRLRTVRQRRPVRQRTALGRGRSRSTEAREGLDFA